jgi:hypothetical protein
MRYNIRIVALMKQIKDCFSSGYISGMGQYSILWRYNVYIVHIYVLNYYIERGSSRYTTIL